MSLLMQALKKAERAKQSHAVDEELAKPSEAFDELIATHEPAPDTLSLSPMEAAAPRPEPAAAEPRAVRSAPLPPRSTSARQYRPPHTGFDARTIRLAALAGAVLMIAAVFGYLYWRAIYGPGSSRKLPMVPMPAQNLPAPSFGSATPAVPAPSYPTGAAVDATTAAQETGPGVMPPGAQPNLPAPPPPPYVPLSDAEETRKIAQENLARADHMDRMLNMDAGMRAPAAAQPAATAPQYPAASPPPSPYPAASAPPSPYPVASAAPSPYPAASAPPSQYSLAGGTPALQAAQGGAPAGSGNIRVAHSSTLEKVDPALARGYAAFNGGDFAAASEQYQSVLKRDANNRDALLGMAALALRAHQPDQAADLYAQLLELDPNDSDALAGLAGLRQGDVAQTEGRLRRVLARTPEAAPLLFALGNLYARQGRWPDAQQQYFKAVAAAPENADYAFNLAVGLDRLGQGKLALNYYRRALSLNPNGAVDFDRNAATQRVRELGGQ